jgi:hypothetical protein
VTHSYLSVNEPSSQPQPAYLCAMMALPRAGKGPGEGTHMALVDPSLIACVAIVVVVSWNGRSWPAPGRGCRETLPKDVPVPREAAYSPTPEADRPATPEWVGRDDSHDSVSSAARQPGGLVRPNAFVDSWPCPSRSPCLGTWRGGALPSAEHPARRRATSAQRVHSLTRRAAAVRIMVPPFPVRAVLRADNQSLMFVVNGPRSWPPTQPGRSRPTDADAGGVQSRPASGFGCTCVRSSSEASSCSWSP